MISIDLSETAKKSALEIRDNTWDKIQSKKNLRIFFPTKFFSNKFFSDKKFSDFFLD